MIITTKVSCKLCTKSAAYFVALLFKSIKLKKGTEKLLTKSKTWCIIINVKLRKGTKRKKNRISIVLTPLIVTECDVKQYSAFAPITQSAEVTYSKCVKSEFESR